MEINATCVMVVRNLGIDSCEQGDEEETLGRVGRRSFHCRRDKAPCVCGQLGTESAAL